MKGASVICSWVLMVLSGQSVGGQQVLRVRPLGQRALLDLKAEENRVSFRAAPLEVWFRRLQWLLRTCWKCKLLDCSTEHRQWRAGKPGRLQPTGLQRVGPDLVTERPPATQSYSIRNSGSGAQPSVLQWSFQVVLVSAGELLHWSGYSQPVARNSHWGRHSLLQRRRSFLKTRDGCRIIQSWDAASSCCGRITGRKEKLWTRNCEAKSWSEK